MQQFKKILALIVLISLISVVSASSSSNDCICGSNDFPTSINSIEIIDFCFHAEGWTDPTYIALEKWNQPRYYTPLKSYIDTFGKFEKYNANWQKYKIR